MLHMNWTVPNGKTSVRLIFVMSVVLLSGTIAQQSLPDAPSATKTGIAHIARKAEKGWPRTFTSADDRFIIYQPQVEKWEGNRIDLYSAVELKSGKDNSAKYGVVWLEARTEVDKVNRLVTLDQAKVTKVKFPAAADKESSLMHLLQTKLPAATKTVSLDRLEAAVELDKEVIKTVEVKNDPPKVIVASKPSLLVLVDGPPQMRKLPDTEVQQIINTKSTILFFQDKKLYFLRVQKWWLQSEELEGPWKRVEKLPEEVKKAEEALAGQQLAESPDAKPSQQATPNEAGKKAEVPMVYVAFEPAELIETKGEPQYDRIPGTGLEYATNTNGNIFRFNGQYYILISGRWFKGASLDGAWTFVNGNELPADFAKIPGDNPKATVLASVPGTSQSKEALIANSIPQTATITRSEAKLTVQYDGEPTFAPVQGTSLQYASNTSAAVIKVSDRQYFCVEAGVWFEGPTPQGPWSAADSVPPEIYTIPPGSPLHYVTYVEVYGSTPELVYVGYTPGYYGTVVSASTNTVVYGTGWHYAPYIGPTVWYGWPYTYGVGAGFTYTTDSGWSFGFGYGYTYYPGYYPWWGPMGYYGCCWYPYYGWGAWGGAAAANVYGVWGNTAYSRTAAAWANPYTGNYGAASRGAYHNNQTGRSTIAGRGSNTNIYTGNTAGYRGAATYNPNTGIVAGGGAGYAGNIYSGQGAAGRGGFAYNTNTNAGIAAGKNNVYAGKDGSVYRYNRDSGNWSVNNGSGWDSVKRPQPTLQNQYEMRNQGTTRTQNFNSMGSVGGARVRGGGGGRRR
jgi:hypothetical protein